MRRVSVAKLCAAVACAGFAAAGCASSAKPAATSIAVTLQFENVRREAGLDEWTSIQQVLSKHSTRPVIGQPSSLRRLGGMEVRNYAAEVTVPTFSTLDAIQQDFETLAGSSQGRANEGFFDSIGRAFSGTTETTSSAASERIEMSLAGAQVRYLSNFVGSTLSVAISGITAHGHDVTLYSEAAADPITVRAGRGGLWSARLRAVPADGWVYGVSEDPTSRVRPRYFRVNASTMRQEMIGREQFEKARPPTPTTPTAPTAPRIPPAAPAASPASEAAAPDEKPSARYGNSEPVRSAPKRGTWADG